MVQAMDQTAVEGAMVQSASDGSVEGAISQGVMEGAIVGARDGSGSSKLSFNNF